MAGCFVFFLMIWEVRAQRERQNSLPRVDLGENETFPSVIPSSRQQLPL